MLIQSEAEYLLKILKKLVDKQTITFPQSGEYKGLDVISVERKEKFIIDINRAGRINISKCTYQKRYQKEAILLRLDINGPPHTNPDGETFVCPHLHIYKEGYGDRWAYQLPSDFSNSDLINKLIEFLEYCKITNVGDLTVQRVLEL